MEKHFKDRLFRLVYVDRPDGVPVISIPTLVRHRDTGESVVVAARAGEASTSFFPVSRRWQDRNLPKGHFSIQLAWESPFKTKAVDEIYHHICTLEDADAVDTFLGVNNRLEYRIKLPIRMGKDDPVEPKTLREVLHYLSILMDVDAIEEFLRANSKVAPCIRRALGEMLAVTVRRVLVLAESDGAPQVDTVDHLNSVCWRTREGGPELLVEFLLSKFCRQLRWGWARRSNPSEKIFPDYEYQLFSTVAPERDEADYDRICEYDFGSQVTLDDLIEHEQDVGVDDDEGYYCEQSSNSFYYYSVNLHALSRLRSMIQIPHRVSEVLSIEQKLKLDSDVPQILNAEIDYIMQVVLKRSAPIY